MQKNYYGVIPAPVRHSNSISSTSKLIYAELSAMSNETGEIVLSNTVVTELSELYSIDKRTVNRSIDELISSSFISVGEKKGLSRVVSIKDVTIIKKDDAVKEKSSSTRNDAIDIISFWNELFGSEFRAIDSRISNINARLKSFSKEEIKESIVNRHSVSVNDPWWSKPENSHFKDNIDSFVSSDKKIEKYLSAKERVNAKPQQIKSIKFE